MKVNKLQDKISDLIREETKEAEMMGEVMGQDEQYYEGIGPDPWSCAGAVLKLVADEIKALPDLDIQGTAWVQTEHVLALLETGI